MKKQKNDGHEGADKPSKVTISGLKAPASDSLRQSLYIAALDRFLGISGLIWPITDQHSGKIYEFDFFQPERGTLIKVLRSLNVKEVRDYAERYEDSDLDVIFIVDTEKLGLPAQACAECGQEFPPTDDTLVVLAEEYDSYIFHSGRLWEVNGAEGPSDDAHIWMPVMPMEREILVDLMVGLGAAPVGVYGLPASIGGKLTK